MRCTVRGVLVGLLAAAPALAADAPGVIEVSNAWTPATTQDRIDAPIYMTVANHGDAPDNLLRFRCPVADFTEKHMTDRGEGGYAMREVKAIAIPAGGTVTLAPRGPHLMLLHTKQAFNPGETFTCSLSFQKAGSVSVEVAVKPGEGGASEKS